MRITFILPGYPWEPVGGFRIVYEWSNHLVGRGHDVTVVHPRRLPNWNPPLPSRLYRRMRARGARWAGRFITPRVRWQRIDARVRMLYVPEPTAKYVPEADAVFATWWATAELVAEYPDRKGRKHYLIQHYETWGGPKDRIDSTWRAPLRKIVIAEWLLRKGIELRAPVDDFVHIPNAIDQRVFRVSRPIEGRPPRVAMLHSELEWKGSADGVAALGLAKEHLPELQAVLFGVTSRPPRLPRWIEYVRKPSQRALVEDIYNGSRVYLCPSWMEGWHLPPAEAMACGCAVASTDIGGVRDYATHESTALLSPVRQPDALAESIVRLASNDELHRRIARRGHQQIKEFTWEQNVRRLEEFLMQPSTLSS